MQGWDDLKELRRWKDNIKCKLDDMTWIGHTSQISNIRRALVNKLMDLRVAVNDGWLDEQLIVSYDVLCFMELFSLNGRSIFYRKGQSDSWLMEMPGLWTVPSVSVFNKACNLTGDHVSHSYPLISWRGSLILSILPLSVRVTHLAISYSIVNVGIRYFTLNLSCN
jgi:hypothetical protein